MNETNWFEWAVGLVMAAGGWIFKRHVRRVDELEEQMRGRVSKEDFDNLADTVRAEVAAIHARMDRKFDDQTQRIFEMLRDRRQ